MQTTSTGTRLCVDAADLARPIADGASICVNGVCLTVTTSTPSTVTFDVVPETLTRSTLAALKHGDPVNLEPSLRPNDRMDGHLVQGHVDGTAAIARIDCTGGQQLWTFKPEAALMPFLIPKGSVAIDGISLTLAAVEATTFSIALIPTTLAMTTLTDRKVGDRVNVETDIVARTVVRTLERWRETNGGENLTVDMLRSQGW